MTATERFVHNVLANVATGETWLPEAAWYLRAVNTTLPAERLARQFIDALEWRAAVEMYSDPLHDDGDLPYGANRQEVNRLRREEAERQLSAAVAELAGVAAA